MMCVEKINDSILCTLCENAFLNTTVGTWRFESSLQVALNCLRFSFVVSYIEKNLQLK